MCPRVFVFNFPPIAKVIVRWATAKTLICRGSNLVDLYSIMGPVYQLPHNINIVHITETSLWLTLLALILSLLPQNLFANMSHPMSSHIALSIEASSTQITFVRFLSSMYSLMSHHLVLGWKSLWTEAASKGSVLLGTHYICNKRKHS